MRPNAVRSVRMHIAHKYNTNTQTKWSGLQSGSVAPVVLCAVSRI